MQIGFIGLGAMGSPMAGRLLAAGHQLSVFDLNEAAVAAATAAGAVGCSTPAAVATTAEMVLLSLPNSAIVNQVVSGADGVLAGAVAGCTVIDLSSVDPQTTRTLAGMAAAQGVSYLDAPVSGGVAGAEGGTLTIMLGAPERALPAVLPLLRILGKKIIHVGEVGAGDAVKIVNNLLLGANMAALAEALVLGKKLGLTAEVMLEVIGQGSGKSYVLDAKMEKFIMAGQFQPGFAVELQYKDLGLALDAAREVRQPLPMASQARQLFEMARAMGFGQEDISAVVKVWEEVSATTVRAEQK